MTSLKSAVIFIASTLFFIMCYSIVLSGIFLGALFMNEGINKLITGHQTLTVFVAAISMVLTQTFVGDFIFKVLDRSFITKWLKTFHRGFYVFMAACMSVFFIFFRLIA